MLIYLTSLAEEEGGCNEEEQVVCVTRWYTRAGLPSLDSATARVDRSLSISVQSESERRRERRVGIEREQEIAREGEGERGGGGEGEREAHHDAHPQALPRLHTEGTAKTYYSFIAAFDNPNPPCCVLTTTCMMRCNSRCSS